jgi:two-component system, NarL family, response regulator NreC
MGGLTAMSIRLLLADDHAMLREGLKSLIQKESDMTVVGEAENGKQTLELARTVGAHVVVMDVAMPDLNGIEAARKILKGSPNIKVVGLSGHANREFVREMLKAGASAYVLKSRAYEELVRAIREVMKGKKYLSPDIARGVVDEYVGISSSQSENPAFVVLTDREREALQLISEGKSTKEVADALSVSVKTVETHRRNIMEKLNLRSVAELTKYAIREGITSVDA